jgi:hypothetical protein
MLVFVTDLSRVMDSGYALDVRDLGRAPRSPRGEAPRAPALAPRARGRDEDREAAEQRLAKLSSAELHRHLMRARARAREHAAAATAPAARPDTDYDDLKAGFEFLPSEDSWKQVDDHTARLAEAYHARLYKEFAIADLSRAEEGALGLRWRTEQEVIVGTGQLTCGAKVRPSLCCLF